MDNGTAILVGLGGALLGAAAAGVATLLAGLVIEGEKRRRELRAEVMTDTLPGLISDAHTLYGMCQTRDQAVTHRDLHIRLEDLGRSVLMADRDDSSLLRRPTSSLFAASTLLGLPPFQAHSPSIPADRFERAEPLLLDVFGGLCTYRDFIVYQARKGPVSSMLWQARKPIHAAPHRLRSAVRMRRAVGWASRWVRRLRNRRRRDQGSGPPVGAATIRRHAYTCPEGAGEDSSLTDRHPPSTARQRTLRVRLAQVGGFLAGSLSVDPPSRSRAFTSHVPVAYGSSDRPGRVRDDEPREDRGLAAPLAPRLRPYTSAAEAAREARARGAAPEEADQAAALAWERAEAGLRTGGDG